jgi:hypothetical protein
MAMGMPACPSGRLSGLPVQLSADKRSARTANFQTVQIQSLANHFRLGTRIAQEHVQEPPTLVGDTP